MSNKINKIKKGSSLNTIKTCKYSLTIKTKEQNKNTKQI